VKKQLEIPHAHSEAIQLVSVCKVSKWFLKVGGQNLIFNVRLILKVPEVIFLCRQNVKVN
jgi:hypothetical protein